MSKKSASSASGVLGFVRNLSRDTASPDVLSIEGLLDATAFEKELARERCRVDRGGPPFALLAIYIDLTRGSAEFAQAVWVLSAVLQERTRIIDSKGWFKDRVGVILPGANAEHLPKICAQFEAEFKRRSRVPAVPGKSGPLGLRYETFVYPNDGKHSALHEAGAEDKKH